MNKLSLLLLLVVSLLIGCGKNSVEPIDDPIASLSSSSIGDVSSSSSVVSSSSSVVSGPPVMLTKVGVLAKTPAVINQMDSSLYDIELDTVLGTTSNYFIIENNSESDIVGLSITSSHSAFKITPDTLVTLAAPTKKTGLTQLIKLTVEHGKAANGVEIGDLLIGNQYDTLTISGSNAEGYFEVKYIVHVYAKAMILVADTVFGGLNGGFTVLNYIDSRSSKSCSIDAPKMGALITASDSNYVYDDGVEFLQTSDLMYFTANGDTIDRVAISNMRNMVGYILDDIAITNCPIMFMNYKTNRLDIK